MGFFTSKIFAGVLGTGFTLAGAGLVFTQTETLNHIKDFAHESSAKIVQYEANEQALLDKINVLKTNANSKIADANNTIDANKKEIAELEDKKAQLESQISSLQSDINSLQSQLDSTSGDLASTKQALEDKTNQYNAKVAELNKANDTIKKYKELANYAYNKAKEADKHVTQLEGEVQKANAEVADTGKVVDQAKDQTKDDQPLSQDEVDGINTNVDSVQQ